MKRLRTLFDAKLWKFLLVGVINTLVGTGIMFGLYNLANCSYWVSSAANYVLTSILSFFLNKHFTFQSRERGAGQVVRFAANIAVCYLIAYGIARRHGALHRSELPRPALFCLPQPENRRKMRPIPGCAASGNSF